MLLIPLLLSLIQAVPEASDKNAVPNDLLDELEGHWSGVLEYVDYQSEESVRLPASVRAELSGDQSFLISQIAFGDGDHVVRDTNVSALAPDSSALVSVDLVGGHCEPKRRSIVSFERLERGSWRLVSTEKGIDNGRSAALRIEEQLRGDSYRRTTHVRYLDADAAEFVRNELRLERARDPAEPNELVGTWRVDLRPTPDSEPYFQELSLRFASNDDEESKVPQLVGSFYGTEVRNLRFNRDWDALHLAFVTEDGSGMYLSSARLVEGQLHGTTHSLGRGFLSVWTAERVR